jgi:hypothetical protein
MSVQEDVVMSLDEEVKEGSIDMLRLLATKSGDEVFLVRKDWAIISNTIRMLLESHPNGDEMKLPMESKELSLIVEFMNKHQGVDCEIPPTPLPGCNLDLVFTVRKICYTY